MKIHTRYKLILYAAFRLINAKVRIGSSLNSSSNILCGVVTKAQGAELGSTVTVRCPLPISGRYISVHGDELYLTICEFKAYETDLPCPHPSNFPVGDPSKYVNLNIFTSFIF